jgi:sporulation protein YlmC with PRC-barrel domain
MEMSVAELYGRGVIAADGRAVGLVATVVIDVETWSVTALRVRLRNDVAERIGLDRSLFRATTVDVPVTRIQSVGDALVLTVPVSGLQKDALRAGQPMPSPGTAP